MSQLTQIYRESTAWAKGAAAFMALLAVVSGYSALVYATRASAPDVALQLMGTDGQALVRSELKLGARDPENLDFGPRSEARAQTALQSEPLNPRAFLILGLVRKGEGEKAASFAMLQLAEKLSRRFETVQLLLVESAEQDGDLDSAVRYIDTAMLTSDAADELLFPYMLQSLRDERFRSALVPYLNRDVDWMSPFLEFSLEQSVGAANWSQLVRAAGGLPDKAGYRDLERLLLLKLSEQKAFGELRRLALSGSLSVPYQGQTGALLAASDTSTLLDWQLTNDAKTQVTIYPNPETQEPETVLDIRSSEAAPHTVAQKLILAEPGEYQLIADVEIGQMEVETRVTCESPQGSETKAVSKVQPGSRGRVRLEVSVPETDCEAQFITISSASRSFGGSEADGQFARMQLLPAAADLQN